MEWVRHVESVSTTGGLKAKSSISGRIGGMVRMQAIVGWIPTLGNRSYLTLRN